MTDPGENTHGGYAVPPRPPLPGYDSPQHPIAPAPQYAPPAPPYGYAPPPQGYGPYVAPAPAPMREAGSGGLGLVSLLLALGAAVLAPIAASIAAFNIGRGLGRNGALRSLETMTNFDFDWSFFTPVRDWVLLAEVAFWSGTVLGIWAIVQGIIAIAQRRGRGAGIAAIVIAVLGPVVFVVVVQIFGATGFGAGMSAGDWTSALGG